MKLTRLYGEGKGGGGGSEDPNTLQSKAYISLIDLLSEGPIEGFCDNSYITIVDAILKHQPEVDGDGGIVFSSNLWVKDADGVVVGKRDSADSLAYKPIVNEDNQGYPFSLVKPIKLEIYGLDESLTTDAAKVAVVYVIVYPRSTAERDAYVTSISTRFGNVPQREAFKASLKIYPEGKVRGLYVHAKGSIYKDKAILAVIPRAIGAAMFFDGVAVNDPVDLSPRFQDIGLQYRLGYEDQSVMSGFKTVREIHDLAANNVVKYTETAEINQWMTVWETNTPTDYDQVVIDVTFANGLNYTDLKHGDIKEYTVRLKFQHQYGRLFPDGHIEWSSVMPLGSDTGEFFVRGKTMSAYERSYSCVLHRPNRAENFYWRVQCQRLTRDDNTSDASSVRRTSEFRIVRVTSHIQERLNYPFCAMVGIRINAEQFNRLPVRSYQLKLMKCFVPDTYFPPYSVKVVKDAQGNEISRSIRQFAEYCRDPETGEGVYDENGNPIDQEWTGNFYLSWTNNPAWICFTVCTEPRWGLGKVIPSASKWWHYKIGRYCDEHGPFNGAGNPEESRFTCNAYFQTREEAFKVLTDLASSFAGYYYYGGGAVVPVQDAPKTPRMSFTPANVKEGLFNYRGTQRKTRHTVAVVSYNEPKSDYKLVPVYVEDPEGIARYGYNTIEKVAFGTISQGQARRVGKRILRQELSNTDTVSFVTGVQGSVLRPGDVFSVFDPTRSSVPFGGRILSIVTSPEAPAGDGLPALITDREISDLALCRAANVATINDVKAADFTVVCTKPTAAIEEPQTAADIDKMMTSQLTAPLRIKFFDKDPYGRRIIKLAEPLPAGVEVGMLWSLQHARVMPQYFSTVSVEETGKHEFTVTGLEYHEQLYDEVFYDTHYWEESVVPDLDHWKRPTPPINLTLQFITLRDQGTVAYRLAVSWSPPETGWAKEYIVYLKQNLGNFQEITRTKDNHVDLTIGEPDSYTVRVVAVGITGIRSEPVEANIGYLSGSNQEIISGLEVFFQGNDNNFYGGDLDIDWRINWSGADTGFHTAVPPVIPGSIDSYLVRLLNPADNSVLREEYVTATNWSLTMYQNKALPSGPYRDLIVEVRARTNDLALSAPTRIRCTNAQPGKLTNSDIEVTTNELGLFQIKFKTSSSGADFAGYRVFASLSTNFTPSEETLVWEGQSTISAGIALQGATNPDTIYFRVAEIDLLTSGVTDCAISDEFSVNVSKTVGLATLSVFDFLNV